MVRMIVVVIAAMVFVGCNLGNDDDAQRAIKLVQDFQPSSSGTSIMQMVTKTFSTDEWLASKTTDGMYRVTYRGSKSGQSKELIFSVSTYSKRVIALNRDALAYTNPM